MKDRLFTVNRYNKKRLFVIGGHTNTGQSVLPFIPNLNTFDNTRGSSSTAVQSRPYENQALSQTLNDYIDNTRQSMEGNNLLGSNRDLTLNTQQTKSNDNNVFNGIIGKTSSALQLAKPLISDLSKPTTNVINNALSSTAEDALSTFSNNLTSGLSASIGSSTTSGILSPVFKEGASSIWESTLPTAANSVSTYTPLLGSADIGSMINGSKPLGMLAAEKAASAPATINGITDGIGGAGNTLGKAASPTLMTKLGSAWGANNLSTLGKIGVGLAGSLAGTGLNLGISDGFKTKTGSYINSIGSLVGTGVGMINPLIGAAVTAASGLISGIANRGWGHKTFNVDQAKGYLNNMSGIKIGGSNDTISQLASMLPSYQKVTYKDGWFTDKGKNEARAWNKKLQDTSNFLGRSINNASMNNIRKQMEQQQANLSAYGGLINGPTDYNFMSDIVTTNNNNMMQNDRMTTLPNSFMNTSKENTLAKGGKIHIKPQNRGRLTELKKRTGKTEAELYRTGNKHTRAMITFARNSRKWKHALGGPLVDDYDDIPLFALGGDIQTHGADFTNGVTQINTGGSHEENPNEGVQMGQDEEGTPNLVEEGEVVWNDFVFSNRLNVPKEVRKELGLRGKKDISFADAVKQLQKESEERPNDPISQEGLNAALSQLADAQEQMKQEMAADSARAQFESLPPEQQQQLIQQYMQAVQQQESQAQQQQMAEQQMMEQQQQPMDQQQISPEEQQMIQQQQAQQMAEPLQQQPQGEMQAYGGRLYATGGKLKVLDFLNLLGYKGTTDASKAGWKPEDFGVKNWKDLTSRTPMPSDFSWESNAKEYAKRVSDPALKAAFSLGYTPFSNKLDARWFEDAGGNKVGWSQSVGKDKLTAKELEDYTKRYQNTLGWALDKGIIKVPEGDDTISMADVVKAMRQAPDWAATDNWLFSSPDARKHQQEYLGRAMDLNDPNDEKFKKAWEKWGTFSKDADGNSKYTLKDNLTKDEYKAFVDYMQKSRNDNMVGVMYNNMQTPDNVATNYLIDKDGNIQGILNDTTGYKQAGSPFTWGNTEDYINNTANFFMENTPKKVEEPIKGKKKIAPVLYDEWPRYVGLMGPATALGMQAIGIGKPDLSAVKSAVAQSRQNPAIIADYRPIGNYMKYQPLDTDYTLNAIRSASAGTQRNIMNSGMGPSQAAALLANDNGMLTKMGEAVRADKADNLKQYAMVQEFNRGTDQYNAEAYNRAAQQYASDYNRQKQFDAQLAMQAAQTQLEADNAWNGSMYANIGNIFKGISDLGRENVFRNDRNKQVASGVFGSMSPDNAMASGIIRWVEPEENKKACGGRINKRKKRKGLTF